MFYICRITDQILSVTIYLQAFIDRKATVCFTTKVEGGVSMNSLPKLPDSELQIMLILWQKNEPMTRAEIDRILAREKPLAKTTVLTLLTRLEKKGFIEITRSGREHLYTAAVSKEDYRCRESRSFLKNFYGDSVSGFIAALADEKPLSDDEISELRRFIDTLSAKEN